MTKKKVFYKIQNPEGLFSTGGKNPNFSVLGKRWSTLEALELHLTTHGISILQYSNCKIVEIEEIFHDVEENLLQKIYEQGIVKLMSTLPYNVEYQDMINCLSYFVMYGLCYSTELKEFILERKNIMVDNYVPDYVIENFDQIHNKGIKGCSDSELAAIMLTATPEQQKLYNL